MKNFVKFSRISYFALFATTLGIVHPSSFARPEKVLCPSKEIVIQNASKLDKVVRICDGKYFVYSNGVALEDAGRSWFSGVYGLDSQNSEEAIRVAQKRTKEINGLEAEYALPFYDAYYCTYDSADGEIISLVSPNEETPDCGEINGLASPFNKIK